MPRVTLLFLLAACPLGFSACKKPAPTPAENPESEVATLNRLHRVEVADLKAKIASLESENATVSAQLEETQGLYDYLVKKVSDANIAEDKRLHPDLYRGPSDASN